MGILVKSQWAALEKTIKFIFIFQAYKGIPARGDSKDMPITASASVAAPTPPFSTFVLFLVLVYL